MPSCMCHHGGHGHGLAQAQQRRERIQTESGRFRRRPAAAYTCVFAGMQAAACRQPHAGRAQARLHRLSQCRCAEAAPGSRINAETLASWYQATRHKAQRDLQSTHTLACRPCIRGRTMDANPSKSIVATLLYSGNSFVRGPFRPGGSTRHTTTSSTRHTSTTPQTHPTARARQNMAKYKDGPLQERTKLAAHRVAVEVASENTAATAMLRRTRRPVGAISLSTEGSMEACSRPSPSRLSRTDAICATASACRW